LLVGRTISADDPASAPYDTNVFCLTAFETARFYLEHGPGLFAGRRNIGWWPWELPVWPANWLPAFQLVDEIWAASRFTQQAYLQAMGPGLELPVRLMPLPVSVARRAPCKRQKFRLPARQFLFLYLFDANSWWSRKNPQGALKAFQRAFPADDNTVGLVFKVSHGDSKDRCYRQFAAECAKDPRVHLLSGVMDRPDVLGLMDACDAYVSLHRAEGFGRTLAEALLLGKPVVGTGYSGTTDFLDETTGFPVRFKPKRVRQGDYAFVVDTDGAWWAEPTLAHAAAQMQAARTAAGPKFTADTIARVQDRFSPDGIGQSLRDALRESNLVYPQRDVGLDSGPHRIMRRPFRNHPGVPL
jgi:glycosyltransferase involved in cell wall biosynthesis